MRRKRRHVTRESVSSIGSANIEKALFGAALMLFVLVTMYKLVHAPLWFDETIEYWYSKVMFGTLPFEDTANMYERIISTFQPPLCNVVLWFWLRLGDSEWWVRLFGVLMGLIGMVGLHKTVKRLSNGYVASLAVVVATCTYRLTYYWQEVAEYNLMLATLFWALYFWVCLMEEPSKRNIVCFVIAAVVPVYSQYGAAFPVLALSFVALVRVLLTRDRESIVAIIVSGLVAIVCAALPLYFLFMRKQMLNQQGGSLSLQHLAFEDGILKDLYGSVKKVFAWTFVPQYSGQAVKVILVAAVLVMCVVVVFSKHQTLRFFVAANAVTWLMYWLAVKVGVYSYGTFGNRYNLFFAPLWIVLGVSVLTELCALVSEHMPQEHDAAALCGGALVCLALCYSYHSWTTMIEPNWTKEEARTVASEWYKAGAANSHTLVYYAAGSGFAYYVKQDAGYDASMEQNVVYMPWMRGEDEATYAEYLAGIYGSDWPDELYVVATHTKDDLQTVLGVIEQQGYTRSELYGTRGYLIRLAKSAA